MEVLLPRNAGQTPLLMLRPVPSGTRKRLRWSSWTPAVGAAMAAVGTKALPGRARLRSSRRAGASKDYKNLEVFLEAQRGSPPTSDPLGGPLTPYNDGPVDWMLIAVFRQVMSGVAQWQSPLAFWGTEAYDGMLEVAHAQQWGKTLQQTEDSSMSVIDNLLPEEGKVHISHPPTRLASPLMHHQLTTWISGSSSRETLASPQVSGGLDPRLMGQSCCRSHGDALCDESAPGNQVSPELAEAGACEIERLLRELFRLHDLNNNGLLEIEELVQLNSKVALLHHGKDTNLAAVKARYRQLFKDRLDPHGRPVPYQTFQRYVVQVLNGIDPDPAAQEMMLEQFVAEAKSARAVFHAPSFASTADKAFLPHLSFHVNSFPRRLTCKDFMIPDEETVEIPTETKAALGGA